MNSSFRLQRLVNFSVARRHLSERFNITGTLATSGPVVGAFAEVKHTFPQAEVNQFAGICGDNNRLHTDPEFAKGTMFGNTIVHGILVSSLFSTLFGRSIEGAVYVSQSLSFKSPVYVNTEVVTRMQVLRSEVKRKGTLLVCSTTVHIAGSNMLAVDGEAKVLLPFPTNSSKIEPSIGK